MNDAISKWMFQMYTFYRTELTIPDVAFCWTNHIDTLVRLICLKKKNLAFRDFQLLIHNGQMVLRVRSLSILSIVPKQTKIIFWISFNGKKKVWMAHSEKRHHINTYQIHHQCDKSVRVRMSAPAWSNIFSFQVFWCFKLWFNSPLSPPKQSDKIIDKAKMDAHVHTCASVFDLQWESQKATFGQKFVIQLNSRLHKIVSCECFFQFTIL